MAFTLSHTIQSRTFEDVFSVRFSPDGNSLLAGCSDGVIKFIDFRNGKELGKFSAGKGSAIVCIRFPQTGINRHLALAACSDGLVSIWNVSTLKCVSSIQEENNEVYTADYSQDGSTYAVGGSDKRIRLYGEKGLVTVLGTKTEGHNNRVVALRFSAGDPSILISGGWDKTIKVWDVRQPLKPVRSIFGPYIAGEALDLNGNMIVSGSCRLTEQIEMWDLTSGKKINTVAWPANDQGKKEDPMVYACQFSKDGNYIAAGGSFCGEARIFSTNSLVTCGGVYDLHCNIYSADFLEGGSTMAFGGGSGAVLVLNYSNTGSGLTRSNLLKPTAAEPDRSRKSPMRPKHL